MKAKKKNPHISLRRSDVERIKAECTKDAISSAFVIFLTVMHDKEGFGQTRLARVFKEINELSEMVSEGYVTIERLRKALVDEMKIEVKVN